MRIQVLFLLLPALLPPVTTHAGCFDFATKIVKPLKEPIALDPAGDAAVKGQTDDGVTWAAVRAKVDRPIGRLYELLLDHDTTKSGRVDETVVEKIEKPDTLAFHHVKFLIKPFLFVKIRWTEAWAYTLAAGTAAKPEILVVSYEKIDGTSHIEHLCGSMVLRKLGDGSTDTYLYEEAKATQRSPEDTLKGMRGTLEALRRR